MWGGRGDLGKEARGVSLKGYSTTGDQNLWRESQWKFFIYLLDDFD